MEFRPGVITADQAAALNRMVAMLREYHPRIVGGPGILVSRSQSGQTVSLQRFQLPIPSSGSSGGSGTGTATGDGSGTGTASSGASGTGTATGTGTGVGTTIEFITEICPIFEDDDCCDGGGGTVTSVGAQFVGDGMTIIGSPITDSGTFQFALDDDLAALEALTGTGIPWRTGVSTWSMASNIVYSTGDTLTINTPAASNIPLIVNGTAGQLASLTEWRRGDTGVVLARMVGTVTGNSVSLDIAQGYAGGIPGGFIQVNVLGVKAGLRRGGLDHFLYYDLSSGNTIVAQVFGSGRVSLRGQSGAERVGVNSTGLSFYGGTPVAQPSAAGSTAGFTAGAGANVTVDSTFTGGIGTTAYTPDDIIRALKLLNLIAQ